MVARARCRCKKCGGESFHAEVFTNDMPYSDSPDEWWFFTSFTCRECGEEAFRATNSQGGDVSATSKLA